MTTRLTLISNASTVAVRHAIFPDDEAIDVNGAKKAAAAASHIGKPDRIYTSPLLRARQTAEALSLAATPDFAIRDSDYGHWKGRRFDEVAAENPDAFASWTSDPSFSGHGGEPLTDIIARAAAWLDGVSLQAGHTLVVTHAAIIRAAIIHAIGAPPTSFWRIDIAPLTLTDLRYDHGRWTLRTSGYAP
ncbi:MAG: histidine phosphatase family protein [Parvibaculaceae bacterium]